MKKLSVIISSFCVMLSYAQKVSDYKYISVPEKFEDFKRNHFGMDKVLSKILTTKKYTVLSGNRNSWPAEANMNPCNVLNANILNDSSLLRSKLILQFKDCNDKVIASQKGMTLEKEYEIGFPEALTQALVNVPVSKPVENINYRQDVQFTETAQQTSQVSEQKSQASKAEKYSNGKLSLQKIQIDASQFILVDGNSSVPFATFKETTKKDVFRVKLGSGESTTGYYENGNLVIEILKSNDEYSKEVFSPVK